MSALENQLSDRANALKPSAIRAMAKQAGMPGVVSFAAGAPSASQFPFEALRGATDAILSDPLRRAEALQYGASEGYLPLREFVADQLGSPEWPISPDDVLITSGSQQALEFVGKTFINEGDRVIACSPTYVGALQAFGLFEPEFVAIPLNDSGLDLAALEAELKAGAKFFYVMPDHGNPNGTMLTLAQRKAILSLARQYEIPIIEDQAYDQLQLSGERLPTLLELDRASDAAAPIVSYLGTFSKSLTPGLRVGWIITAQPIIAKLVSIKQASDLNSGMLNQMIVNDVARDIMVSHGTKLRAFYKGQRDAMLNALKAHMPDTVSWTKPKGGMFVWLTLPAGMDAGALLQTAFEQERVIFVPGASFHSDGSGVNTLRLSYSLPSTQQIADGIAGLARVIRSLSAG
ncbi:PLP-dependent aminotransferase family protein [Sulfitobacter sp. F26204]|uniref:aminotransferase-like domain-containing protein n=1 Tax=Sulfitobacter sp. F26204 TaxID=2996014 RepID=UPI00225E0D7E|nr:PLP-dependent aminotransferase family protein [Sulfitobacter sp. F26204]MCX7561358.1 PLP-dependent aminotransferase family protein [Sulfitobacter sp. F26204]